MIRLRDLLTNGFVTLELTEANSGYSSTLIQKDLTGKIYNAFNRLLNGVDRKDIPLIELQQSNMLRKQISDGEPIELNVSDSVVNYQGIVKIDVLLTLVQSNNHVIIEGAATDLYSSPIEVYLKINSQYSMNDVLQHESTIESLACHESIHIIKHLQGLHQKAINRDDNLSVKNDKWWYDYYSNSGELHSYIAQLNNELKHIKQANLNISFSDAVNKSKIWRRYKNSVFIKNPKVKSKMLSKLAHYWNNKLTE